MRQYIIFFLGIFLCACNVPATPSISLDTQVIFKVSALSPGGKSILFESGAEVRILKDKKVLAVSTLETINKVDNQCIVSPLKEEPPYSIEVKNAKINQKRTK